MRTRHSLEAENRELHARIVALEAGWRAAQAELEEVRRKLAHLENVVRLLNDGTTLKVTA